MNKYQLFLFDFDGLLVNTEKIHYLAYKMMLKNRGFQLGWDFEQYCLHAHYGKERLARALFEAHPKLHASFEEIYIEKQQNMLALLREGEAELMPGVEKLLLQLEKKGVKRCVVTNSPHELIAIVRKQLPVLNTIPTWITREHYTEAKPDPECFLKAISMLGEEGDAIVGFEDTPKGIEALLKTAAKPIFVTQIPYPEIERFSKEGVTVLSSLK